MELPLRAVGIDRGLDFFRPITTGFGLSNTVERSERFFKLPELRHAIGAFDGDEIVGSAGALDLTLTTPGGAVRVAGLSVVAVLPSHRRQGVLTSLVRRHFDDARADGQPVSALWASEAQIYGRFGYGLASFCGDVTVPRDRAGFAVPIARQGTVRLLDQGAAHERLPPIWERLRERQPGLLSRSSTWWNLRLLEDVESRRGGKGDLQRAVVTLNDRDEAYALYRVGHRWDHSVPRSRVEVVEACGATPEGTALVWRYLLDLDTVEEISAGLLPTDHPLLLLLAEPRRAGFRLRDGLWIRILDVERALAARTYGRDDRLVLEIDDAFCPENRGRWRLDGGACRADRTDAQPDLRVSIEALGSAYLGGHLPSRLALANRGVTALTGDALARADALFHAAQAPWCPEVF